MFRGTAAAWVIGWAALSHAAIAAPVADNTGGDLPASAAPSDATDAPGSSKGEDIVVTGQKPANEAFGGTKTSTPLIETPQSISVVTNADIANLGLQNLNQALRFVAGVTPETRGASAEVYDQFKLRGFDAPIYLDGLKLFQSATGFAVPQVDVSRLDRFEVIKGPASALYGQSGPGGLVAEESKLPLDRGFYGALAGTYGTFDLYRVDADVGGKATDDIAWRLYGSANGAHDQQQFGRRERQTVSGAVTVGAGSRTSLTVLAAYSHDPLNGNYGIFPAVGTLIRNPAGRISSNFYSGEPGDFFKREQLGLTYIFRHDLGGGWTFRTLGRYQYVSSRLGVVYASGYPADASSPMPSPAPTLYSRYSYSTKEQVNSWTYDNQLSGKLDTGPLRHELLFGVDRQVAHSAESAAFGLATPIDVFDPVYGTTPTPHYPDEVNTPLGPSYQHVDQRQQGVYAQDQISLAGLRLVLSGRQDWARQKSLVAEKHDDKFTYRAGALYLLPFGLAPYVSYSTSFQPQSNTLTNGGIADPSLGKQLEAGAKYTVPGTQILLTAAWFDIKQTNVVVSNPTTRLANQVGRVRSRGIEFEGTAPLPYGFNAKVAYSRQRVKVLDDLNPVHIGLPLVTTGRGGVSANLEWGATGGPLAGLVIGGAVRHVDKTYADIYLDGIPRYTPDYTVFDALARYDLGKLDSKLSNVELAVNAMNIFNKRYLTSCFANYGWCWYGNRRTVEGTLSFKF